MTTIFERVNNALETLSPSVAFALAPYKSTGALPDTFIVYQLIHGFPETHADDVEFLRSYLVQVTTWNKSGLAVLPDVDAAMISAGFLKRTERQLPQDHETGHYGLAIDYFYI